MSELLERLKAKKRKRNFLGANGKSPWGYNQQQLFKSHSDAGKSYKIENWTNPHKKIKFPK